MAPIKAYKTWLFTAITIVLVGVVQTANCQDYLLTDTQFLSGDTTSETAVRIQNKTRIAAGGPGYLVVWEDQRTVIEGYLTYPTYPLMGNLIDIYAARLDQDGNLLDPSPIIISNAGLNQTKPEVAWNGENWLVVWETMRSDWYFFMDILGVRVSPEGVVLDSIPINIRLENQNPSGDHGSNPSVTSDGTNWVITWEDRTYRGSLAYPNIVAARISPSGTIIDNPPIILYTGETAGSFGPVGPQMRRAGDELLAIWGYSGAYTVLGKRYDLNLNPIDMNPFGIASTGFNPRLASNGTDFFVVTHDRLGYRITHGGTVLDPNGISFGFGGQTDRGPDAAWDGSNWVVGYSSVNSFTWKIFLTRISSGGVVQGPPYTQVGFGPDDQFNVSLASTGGGNVTTVWDQRSATLTYAENVHSVRVAADWSLSADQDVSLGWHRQTDVHLATIGTEHMMAFQDQGGGLNRICVQRVDNAGNPLDPEPTILSTTAEGYTGISTLSLDITSSNSFYLVIWVINGIIYGQRIEPDGTLIDPAPVSLLSDPVVQASISGLGDDFYLVYSYVISGNQRYLNGVRVNGNTMSLAGAPVQVNGGSTSYALNPIVRSFSDRWFVIWEAQLTHDLRTSTIRGFFVTSDGQAGSHFPISTSGDADHPTMIIGNSRALIAWNEYTSLDGRIKARLMNQDGSFTGNQFLVNDAPNRQFSPSVTWDGSQYTASWVDYRSNTGEVEQLRGDIYASRISYGGTVLDANGIQLTSGPMPEDFAAAAAADGKTLVAFTKMNGANNPEIQRIGYRVIETVTVSPISITMTPNNPPIIIPSSGGNVNFDVFVENVSLSPQNFDAWIDLVYEGGSPTTVIQRSFTSFQPGWTINRSGMFFPVPSTFAAGDYTFTGKVGIFPETVWDESGFPFTKEGVSDGLTFNPWIPSGWADPFAVEMSENDIKPADFMLLDAYPNPFNPTTMIRYALPHTAVVSLTIFDVHGKQVVKLVDGLQDAGIHEVTFDGSGFGSGVYLYRFQAADFSATGKLVMVK